VDGLQKGSVLLLRSNADNVRRWVERKSGLHLLALAREIVNCV